MVLNPESPGTDGHQRVCLGTKHFFLNFGPKPSPEEFTISPSGTGPSCSCQPCCRRGPAGSEDPAAPGRCRAHQARPRARPRLLPSLGCGRGAEERGWLLSAPGGPGAFSTFANAAAPRPAPRPPRAPLLASPDGVQGPGLAAPTAAAAPAAALGDRAGSARRGPGPGFRHGAADRATLRARRVPAHCAQRRLRALPLRGDIPRRPEVRLQVPLPAHPAGFPAPSLRTGLSLPTDLPQLRPANLALLPLPLPPAELPDPKSLSPRGEPTGPCASLVLPPRTGLLEKPVRSGVGASHALPARLERRNLRKMASPW